MGLAFRQASGVDMKREDYNQFASARRNDLRITLTGSPTIHVGEQAVACPSRKGVAVLVYLIAQPAGQADRDMLAGLLWGDQPGDQARTNLRQALWRLKRTLGKAGFDGLTAGRVTISIAPGSASFDIDDMTATQPESLGADVLDRVAAMESCHFLDGFDDLSPSFDIWLRSQRQAWAERIFAALDDGSADKGAPIARRLTMARARMRLDPTNEDVCRRFMALSLEAGDTGGALSAYQRLWDVLDEEFGMEPSATTQALAVRIKLDEDGAQPVTSRRSTTMLHLAAFDMTAFDGERINFGGYLEHEIAGALSRFRDLEVVRVAADQATDVKDGYVLRGAMAPEGDGIFLTANLENCTTGAMVWSERREMPRTQIFSDLLLAGKRFAASAQRQIAAHRLVQTATTPEVEPHPIADQWRQAQELFRDFRPPAWRAAEGKLRAIIDNAPRFSAAYSALAQLENTRHLALTGCPRSADAHTRARELGRRAVELDPSDSRSHLAHGWAHALSGDHDMTIRACGRAAELNDADAWTLTSAALAAAFSGEMNEAERLDAAAMSLADNLTPAHWGYLGTARFVREDFEAAVLAFDHAGDVITNLAAWRAAALAHLDRMDEAAASLANFHTLAADGWTGDGPATPAAIGAWFEEAFPLKRDASLKLLTDGLSRARSAGIDDQPH